MKLENWSQRLRQQLSSDRVVHQYGHRVSIEAMTENGGAWVMGRSDCVFRVLDMAAVPASRLAKAVETQVPLLSPFANPGYLYVKQQSKALVWIWDEQLRRSLALEQGLEADEFTVVPESCFAPCVEDGHFLYDALSGVFVQQWSDGRLLKDHWWPLRPSLAEWKLFLRGSGVPPQDMRDPQKLTLHRPAEWSGIQFGVLNDRFIESFLVNTIATVFIFMFAFQLTGSLRLLAEGSAIAEHIETVSAKHELAIGYRENAFATRAEISALRQLGAQDPLGVMQQTALALPESGKNLLLWQMDGERFEFVVTDAAPDLEDYVRRLEAVPRLVNVSVEPLSKAGQLKISAEVVQL